MYRPDSAPNDAISSSTLYIGLRWPITSTEAVTATSARIQNRKASISLPAVHPDCQVRRHQQVHHRERQQELPAELHQLVIAVARQRPAHPDIEEQQRANLRQEPDPAQRHRQERPMPPAK